MIFIGNNIYSWILSLSGDINYLLKNNKNTNSKIFFCLLNESKILTQLFEGRLVVLDEVDSTNQYIIDNIEYVQPGDACVAEYQTLGRGRCGKNWIAPFGQNICLSIYWRFNHISPMMIEFSLMISMIVAKTLKMLGVSCIQIKWPNDLYINKKKLGGVLIEMITRKNHIVHIIIGIGINLSMRTNKILKDKINNNWISLEDVGIFLDRNVLTATLVNVLRKELKNFKYYGFTSFISCWKIFDFLYKKPIMLFLGDNNIIEGTAIGIDINGGLIVEQSNSIDHYTDTNISVNVL